MEAATLGGRGGFASYAQTIRDAARARSRAFWIVAGLTLLAAGLRFATLGVQSYHHDEIVTASRILRGGFGHAMDAVGFSESAPPLYYAVAWVWTQVTGTGEFGLRSISALAGVATVPVAYLAALELRGRRAGLMAAALVAVNPMLLWYSQEARAYSLFVLLCAVSLLYCVRALRRGRRRDVVLWGVASGLALATHYFAVFPIAAEALWLLRRRRRGSLPGLGIVGLSGLALAPLAVHQMSIGHAEWIGNFSLGHRLEALLGGDKVLAHEDAAHEKRNWVRLSYDCNNHCTFCLDSNAHDGTMRDNMDIKVQIIEGRKKGAERLILSGGEPTMHPNFLDFVKLGKRAGYPKVQTVTNGRMFKYPDFLDTAADERARRDHLLAPRPQRQAPRRAGGHAGRLRRGDGGAQGGARLGAVHRQHRHRDQQDEHQAPARDARDVHRLGRAGVRSPAHHPLRQRLERRARAPLLRSRRQPRPPPEGLRLRAPARRPHLAEPLPAAVHRGLRGSESTSG